VDTIIDTELIESVLEMSGNEIFLGDFNCKGKTSTTIDVRLNDIISMSWIDTERDCTDTFVFIK